MDRIKYSFDNTQERTSEFNNKSIKIIQADSQREKNIERKDENANDLWDNKKSNTKVIEIPERDERIEQKECLKKYGQNFFQVLLKTSTYKPKKLNKPNVG